MNYKNLLEMIWSGAVSRRPAQSRTPAAKLLSVLLPVRPVELVVTGGLLRPELLLDSAELLPGVTLGDVLAEELDLDLPYGSVILLEAAEAAPGRTAREVSGDVGHLMGEMLLRLVGSGALPLERETDALVRLALSSQKLATSPALRLLGLDAERYAASLTEALGIYWSGRQPCGRVASDAFSGPRGLECPEVLDYLGRLDAGFLPPSAETIPDNLLHPRSGVGSYADWAGLVRDAVCANLAAGAA